MGYSQSFTINIAGVVPAGFKVGLTQGSNMFYNIASTNLMSGTNTFNYTPYPLSSGPVVLTIKKTTIDSGTIKILGIVKDSITFTTQTVFTSIASDEGYHYGFNGQMKTNEWAGVGNSLDFGARGYDSRVCRFQTLDKLAQRYPNRLHMNLLQIVQFKKWTLVGWQGISFCLKLLILMAQLKLNV